MSSTVGSSTRIGWKRRSSAASFSMCLRYSSSVVAPIVWSSPRASIGLSRFEASIAPSAAPAPTTVWSSSMNRTTWPSASLISLRTAFRRSSNSPRYFAPAMSAPRSSETTRLSLSVLGHVAADDPLGEALGDRGLADARLADEDRVVLRPPAQDLDDPPDLLVPADDRVELAGAGLGGEVAAVLLERGVGALGVLRGHALAAADALERVEDRLARRAVALEQLAALAADLGDRRAAGARSRRTRRRAGAPPARRARGRASPAGRGRAEPPWIWARLPRIAASSPRKSWQVDADPAKGLGGHAVVGLDERVRGGARRRGRGC